MQQIPRNVLTGTKFARLKQNIYMRKNRQNIVLPQYIWLQKPVPVSRIFCQILAFITENLLVSENLLLSENLLVSEENREFWFCNFEQL